MITNVMCHSIPHTLSGCVCAHKEEPHVGAGQKRPHGDLMSRVIDNWVFISEKETLPVEVD